MKPSVSLIDESIYEQTMQNVRRELDVIRQTVTVTAEDGCRLRCEAYVKEGQHGNLIIVHGFTEFSAKYTETIWYFLSAGFNVFIYDQRGHGFSDRQVENLNLIHVDRFDDYVNDLHTVIERLVLVRNDLPIYLYSHSMGGAVTALYLAKHPNVVTKAVLSSPMVCPHTAGVPRWMVRQLLHRLGKQQGWHTRFPHTGDFDPQVAFEKTQDSSYPRFRAGLDARIQTPQYQSSCATNGWMREALAIQERLLSKKVTTAIQTPILLISGKRDTVVKIPPQRAFARRVKSCRFVSIPDGKHNLFCVNGETLERYYTLILDFLN